MENNMKIEVELEVFSGRKNPRWVLEPDRQAKALALLEKKDPAAIPASAPPQLGYRGFILRVEGGTLLTAREIRVRGVVASVGSGRDMRHFMVPGVEELLVESAVQNGHEAVLSAFRKPSDQK
jgi:hypothetical protein